MRKIDLGQALSEAFAALDAGRPEEARRLARTVERLRPDIPGLAYLYGLVFLAEGQGRKAAQQFQKALAPSPGAVPPLLGLARAQVLQGREPVAAGLYRRLIRLAPDLAEAYAELAELAIRRQDHRDAAVLLHRAVTLRPAHPVWLNNLGAARKALGQWNEAALAFAAAIDADPVHVRAHLNLSSILRRLKRAGEAADLVRAASLMAPGDPAVWLELSLAEKDAGRLPEALSAVEEALSRGQPLAEALWQRAECLRALNRTGEAAAAYRRLLDHDPEDRFGASLVLAGLDGEEAPAAAPVAFVRTLFDEYADRFDQHLIERLSYRAPAVVAEAVFRLLGAGPFDCCDAGCGTGLAGLALQAVVARLDGIDISPRMIEKARERNIYDRLDTGDIAPLLAARPAAYDLVVAADVLIYLGDLEPLFQAVATCLRPGGGFVFTVEAAEGAADGEGARLLESRRFAHGDGYLRRLAGQSGYDILALERVSVRSDRSAPVPGRLVVLRRPS